MSQIEQPPEPRNGKHKLYAFGRSIGMTPAEACRHAGGNVDFGHATKWERSKAVQGWVTYFRSLGQTEEMIAAKRARIEQRLELAAYGNIFEFATIEDMPVFMGEFDDDGDPVTKLVKKPVIDWQKVAASPYGAIISGFKFDKDTGHLTDFDRDPALQAIAQLRDMHGFKAVTKTALTDPTGEKPASLYLISERPMSETDWEAQRAAPG
jgi:hypothetical protein